MHQEPPLAGALPPPGLEWQMGKTAASIQFVNSAERYIADGTTEENEQVLAAAIANVKARLLTIIEWTGPEEYLSMLKKLSRVI